MFTNETIATCREALEQYLVILTAQIFTVDMDDEDAKAELARRIVQTNAALADLQQATTQPQETWEPVPNGYYPYPEPIHSQEGVKVGPGYVQLVGYGKSLDAIRLHGDWVLMRQRTPAQPTKGNNDG